jgi:hypothetical protein
MNRLQGLIFIAVTVVLAAFASVAAAGDHGAAMSSSPIATQEPAAMHRVSGSFEVKLSPKPIENAASSTMLAFFAIDKQFHGPLEAASVGNMLSAGTTVKGSAGYVAIEQVTGKLEGHEGSFVLQHTGTLTRGVPSLSISVVPDSGTGELAGLRGTMAIRIEAGGKHFYDFDYAIDVPPADVLKP